ncbi:MAG: PLD nuclease N-terminal domain-containing protein [Coriobacteriia bacterium]|nr:PLD nuclease N-terminal domain-containing protein [Coriobacteriia bacterium]
MIDTIADALGVSTSVVWGLLGLVIVQVAVQVWALVDLARRPRVRFDRKWIWALIIIFGGNSFIGPIVYAAIGRTAPGEGSAAGGAVAQSDEGRTRRAVDSLYGSDEPR